MVQIHVDKVWWTKRAPYRRTPTQNPNSQHPKLIYPQAGLLITYWSYAPLNVAPLNAMIPVTHVSKPSQSSKVEIRCSRLPLQPIRVLCYKPWLDTLRLLRATLSCLFQNLLAIFVHHESSKFLHFFVRCARRCWKLAKESFRCL